MMNYDCKFYSYTNKQRVNETKKLKYQNIILKDVILAILMIL
jgi:hypothetical protein